MMNENCWVLVGGWEEDIWWGKRVKPTEGTPVSVNFSAEYVIQRDTNHKDIVGFIHTHPGMTAHYSSRDKRTMEAWTLALGKPLVCCIQGIDGLRAWWFLDDESDPIEYQVKSLRGLVFGVTPEEFFQENDE